MSRVLLAADLHNHSWLSDGDGDPRTAFAQCRAAGLDVAALTDHASIPRHLVGGLRQDVDASDASVGVLTPPGDLDRAEWDLVGRLADAHDEPGVFTAIRGFEWTEPRIGHVNVWFSDDFLPVTTPGSVAGLHEWVSEVEPHALFGYNHPGREPGRFNEFRLAPTVVPRMVTLEMFNRYDDYVAVGARSGHVSPLVACLRRGWRPGLIGVSDEHGRDYGLAGKGRAGMWADEHSRSGVRDALLRRHVFATREPGARLEASLGGAEMGATGPRGGTLRVELTLPGSRRPADVVAQLLVDDGGPLPHVHAQWPLDPDGRTDHVVDGLDDADRAYRWAVLRVVDPSRADRSVHLPADEALSRRALAYASPWWLDS